MIIEASEGQRVQIVKINGGITHVSSVQILDGGALVVHEERVGVYGDAQVKRVYAPGQWAQVTLVEA